MPVETDQAERGDQRDISELLSRWSTGEEEALDHLLPVIYHELRRLASSYLKRERSNHTLQTTDLVHEAFMRLATQRQTVWNNRRHFFGVAAQMMRRILVDHARHHLTQKRGSGHAPLSLDEALAVSTEQAPEIVALDEALDGLALTSPEQAKIVELRFFGGLTSNEIARLLGISRSSVTRQLRIARARLYSSLMDEDREA